MCGVAGIFNYADPDRPIDRALLLRMTRTLAHRGPDGEGLHVDGPIGLGHRRLSIVDLSAAGRQPMTTADEACWISYNGEFYNHHAFRTRLAARGCRFRSQSDTETLLQTIRELGPGALDQVAGIFAFAFWDSAHRRLLLARDQLGVKQLYYYDDGRRLLFASEIKALLACVDIPREADPDAVNEYLHFHTPLFDRTFLKSVRQVRAGEYIEVNRWGLSRKVYWHGDGCEPRDGSPSHQVDELRGLLETVVGEQLMSDVPVGAFFSGGIDSTAVAAFAKRNGRPPLCFGLHFTGQGVIDERPYQEAAARALGLTLELTTVDGANFPDDLGRLMYAQDQPVIGAAMIPMYYVSRLAARRVKVCLGGQAADELFGGYARYALADPRQVIASWMTRRPSETTAAAGGPAARGNLGKQLWDWRTVRRVAKRLRPESWNSRYFEHLAKVPAKDWQAIMPSLFNRPAARATFDAVIARSAASHPVDKALDWDRQTYLTGLFQQDDRMSMANSLESRVPLADPRVARFAAHTPAALKLRAGATKWLLREAVADCIPAEVLNRRKVGFDTPAESWMRGRHAGFVRELLHSARARSRGFWNPDAVARLVENRSHPYWFDMVWKLVCIETWATTFLDQQRSLPEHERACETA